MASVDGLTSSDFLQPPASRALARAVHNGNGNGNGMVVVMVKWLVAVGGDVVSGC